MHTLARTPCAREDGSVVLTVRDAVQEWCAKPLRELGEALVAAGIVSGGSSTGAEPVALPTFTFADNSVEERVIGAVGDARGWVVEGAFETGTTACVWEIRAARKGPNLVIDAPAYWPREPAEAVVSLRLDINGDVVVVCTGEGVGNPVHTKIVVRRIPN